MGRDLSKTRRHPRFDCVQAPYPEGERFDHWGFLDRRPLQDPVLAVQPQHHDAGRRQLHGFATMRPPNCCRTQPMLDRLVRPEAPDRLPAGPLMPGAHDLGILAPGFASFAAISGAVPIVRPPTAPASGLLALQCPPAEHYHLQSEKPLWSNPGFSAATPVGPNLEIGRVIATPLHNLAIRLPSVSMSRRLRRGRRRLHVRRGLPVTAASWSAQKLLRRCRRRRSLAAAVVGRYRQHPALAPVSRNTNSHRPRTCDRIEVVVPDRTTPLQRHYARASSTGLRLNSHAVPHRTPFSSGAFAYGVGQIRGFHSLRLIRCFGSGEDGHGPCRLGVGQHRQSGTSRAGDCSNRPPRWRSRVCGVEVLHYFHDHYFLGRPDRRELGKHSRCTGCGIGIVRATGQPGRSSWRRRPADKPNSLSRPPNSCSHSSHPEHP